MLLLEAFLWFKQSDSESLHVWSSHVDGDLSVGCDNNDTLSHTLADVYNGVEH